jgi:phosphoglycerate dehydrogenase-like enzyme
MKLCAWYSEFMTRIAISEVRDMKSDISVAVTSRSFSRHAVLRSEVLDRYPNARFNDDGLSLSDDALIEFAKGAKKMITALERIDESFLSSLPDLEVISKYGVGTDMLDKDALIRHGIKLGWTGGVNKRSVSELVVSFSISLLRNIRASSLELDHGVWKNRTGRCISDRTVGIIGCGHIGKDLVGLLKGFNCHVLAHDILDFPEFYAEFQVEAVALDDLLQRSDIVTLHVPLDDSTRNILSAAKLNLMKSDAILINAARGGLVDEAEVKHMLLSGRLAGAALDVFNHEPAGDIELLKLPNFIGTPHIGGSSEEAILAMGRAAIMGLDDNSIPAADSPLGG